MGKQTERGSSDGSNMNRGESIIIVPLVGLGSYNKDSIVYMITTTL